MFSLSGRLGSVQYVPEKATREETEMAIWQWALLLLFVVWALQSLGVWLQMQHYSDVFKGVTAQYKDGFVGALFGGGGWSAAVRILAGVALVMTGIGVVVLRDSSFDQVQFALIAVIATLIGVAVLTIPFWLRMVRDLSDERKARIRTDERAEIAAHLHDSVLQTLALIQKQSDSPREVKRLARSQERELRGWLYGREVGEQPTTMSVAIAQTCAEVEDGFAIAVSQVVVGDCELEDGMFALIQASKEAMVNAAKHAGVAEVSVYAEIEPDKVTVFVRDRGKGFDPDTVPEDRHGLAGSIRGRMDRHGGQVRLRTAPGEGTEVQLEMPRKTEART